MRYLSYLQSLALIVLIGFQSLLEESGGVYGNYAIFAWMWLIIVLLPFYFSIINKMETTSNLVVYNFFLIGSILVQGFFNCNPIFILLFSFIIVSPFFYLLIRKVSGQNQKPELLLKKKMKCDLFLMIRGLIAENEIELALEELKKLADAKNYQNEINIFSFRLNEINRNIRIGTINSTESAIEKNKVVNSILGVLSKLERKVDC